MNLSGRRRLDFIFVGCVFFAGCDGAHVVFVDDDDDRSKQARERVLVCAPKIQTRAGAPRR